MTATSFSSPQPRRTPSFRIAFPALPAALFAVFALLGGSACENKAIGRLCDVQADGGMNQGLWNQMALECPSQICIKQPVSGQVATAVDTAPFCTAECS